MNGRLGILISLTLSMVIAGCGASSTPSSTAINAPVASTTATPSQAKVPSSETEAVKESDLGLPFYPGAVHGDETLKTDDTVHTKNIKVAQTSADQPDKVIDFYKQKLKAAKGTIQVVRNTNSAELTSQGFDGLLANGKERVTVDAARKKGETRTEINISVESIKAK